MLLWRVFFPLIQWKRNSEVKLKKRMSWTEQRCGFYLCLNKNLYSWNKAHAVWIGKKIRLERMLSLMSNEKEITLRRDSSSSILSNFLQGNLSKILERAIKSEASYWAWLNSPFHGFYSNFLLNELLRLSVVEIFLKGVLSFMCKDLSLYVHKIHW